MAVVPQIITETKASGAQVIDGSLKFDGSYMNKTWGSAPTSSTTQTFSFWLKINEISPSANRFPGIFGGNGSTGGESGFSYRSSSDRIKLELGGGNKYIDTTQVFRDTGWYHIVGVYDTTQATDTDRLKIYINGERVTDISASSYPTSSQASGLLSNSYVDQIGSYTSGANTGDFNLTQFYGIDGLALGPGYFGYTDPLTNTWRPKKFKAEGTIPVTSVLGNGLPSGYSALDAAQYSGTLSNILTDDGNYITASSSNIDFDMGETITASGKTIISKWTSYVSDSYSADYRIQTSNTSDFSIILENSETLASENQTDFKQVNFEPTQNFRYIRFNYTGGGRTARLYLLNITNTTTQNLDFGTNGFYLPMDGNSPIGQDKSGQGNNWTPVNFGGSVALDNPQVSGARPILNTDGGGNVARPGVFGSELNQTIAVTVSNASGNNKYYLDGSLTPNLAFTRGSTITFNTGDSTGNGHPFKLSSTNASGSGGSEYTDGVAYYINGSVVSGSDYVTNYSSGAASGFRGIKWTVPHNQSTTYYYCTIHTGMGNNGAFTSTIDETKADPYAWKNTLALPLVGNKDDVSNQINSGSTTKTIANNGVNISNVNSNFYGGSHYWDGGTTDRLTVTYNSEFQFGTGDFCVEFWVNLSTTSGNQYFWDFDTNGGNLQYNGNVLSYSDGVVAGSGPLYSTGITLPTDKWVHIAFTRESGTGRIFVDGAMRATGTTTYNYNQTSVLDIGNGYDNNGYEITGYMQDFRIYNGVAKYTSDFVVASTSPDILPDTPSGVSGGSKLAKVTDGAVIGDGTTSDYLQVSSSGHSDFSMDGDFTVEWYYYMPSITNTFMWTVGDSKTSTGLELYWGSNGTILKLYTNDGPNTITGGPIVGWSHYAVVRSGSTVTAYYNGISGGTISNSTTFSGNFTIGGEYYNSGITGGLSGPISNFRYIKGTALYTANFTPPTRELTNVTNTKLLCCQSNTSANLAGISPATFSNSGTVYSSNYAASDSFQATAPATNGFDGNITTRSACSSSGCTVTMTFSPALTVGTSLKIWSGYGVASVNGGTAVNFRQTSPRRQWQDLSFTGTLNTIVITGNDSGYGGDASAGECYAVEVDGCILVDGLAGEAIASAGNVAATNFNPFTTDIDAVRGQETGYATWNPLSLRLNQGTLSDGNLTLSATGSYYIEAKSTFDSSMVDNYSELSISSASGSDSFAFGIAASSDAWIISGVGTYLVYRENGAIIRYPGNTTVATVSSYTVGDVLGMAIDSTNVRFYKNNILQGTYAHGYSKDYFVTALNVPNSGTSTMTANFGQKPFKFPPPEGFQPLNAANIKPVKVIARPDQYVGVTTYKGDDQASHIINDLNFNAVPDLVWIKKRDGSGGNQLYDTIRGATKPLQSDSDNDEDNQPTGLIDFVKNGFELGASSIVNGLDGDNGNVPFNYVAWCWKAGGDKNTFNVDDVGYATAAAAGITGLDGTGEMTTAKFLGCSIGTKQGFSIIKYRGLGGGDAKVPHGLSQTPDMVIVKNLDEDVDWAITHSGLIDNRSLRFTTASSNNSGFLGLNKGGLASTYFTINYSDTNLKYVNSSNDDFIAYIWHNVPGVQKFGSYVGNGDDNGTFVETGFRPTLLWIKNTTTNGELWAAHDSKRDPINPAQERLELDAPSQRAVGPDARIKDFLSNGFKIRGTSGEQNTSGDNYIYCAWAEAPTFNLYGGQSNAR